MATLIGVFVASFIDNRRTARDEESKRKQLAMMLGYEIGQMRAILFASNERNKREIDKYKTEVSQGNRYFLKFTDSPLSRSIYDRPTTDLTLLPPESVATITDIYRRLELCNHIRKLGDEVAKQGNGLMPNIVGVPDSVYNSPEMAPVLREIDKAINQFIAYSEMYQSNVVNVIEVCDKALTSLKKIATIDLSQIGRVTMQSPDAQNNPASSAIPPSGAP